MNKSISLDLTFDEVNAILNILGNQPTKSGLFPLMTKIYESASSQLQNAEAPQPEDNRGKPAVVKEEIPVPSSGVDAFKKSSEAI